MGLANLEGACDVQSLSLFELWQPRSHCMCVLGIVHWTDIKISLIQTYCSVIAALASQCSVILPKGETH